MMQCFSLGSARVQRLRCCLRRSPPARRFRWCCSIWRRCPILIAALGWSHWAALVAAVAAAAGLAAVFNSTFFIAFLIGIGLPAWWLGYLALLARAGRGRAGRARMVSGRPPCGLGCDPRHAGGDRRILHFGTDEDSFRGSLRSFLERMFRAAGRTASDAPVPVPPFADSSRVMDFLVAVLPPIAAVLTTAVNMLNLWLASRIVRISGRLNRPPSDLSAMRFPVYAPALIGAAVASLIPARADRQASAQFSPPAMLLAYAVLGSPSCTPSPAA